MENKSLRKKKKVDICIAAFNGEKYIYRTIKSVLRQSYSNFNLYIVDDNSSDKTLEHIRKIKDKRIIVYKNKKNLGMYRNINKCLFYAKSPYVKILCCDDVLDEKCLEKQVGVLEKNPKVSLVYNTSNIINSQDRILFVRRFFSSNNLIKGKTLIRQILKSGRNPLGEPSCIMFRRKDVVRNKLRFDEGLSYVADLDMWIKILKHGDGYYIDEPLSSYRIHGASGTSKLMRKIINEHLTLMGKYGKEFKISYLDRTVFYCKLILFFFGKFLIYKLFVR